MICMVGQNPLIPGRLTSLLVQSWSLRPLQGVTVLRADRKQPEELKRAISAVAGYKTKSPKRWDVFSFFLCVCALFCCVLFLRLLAFYFVMFSHMNVNTWIPNTSCQFGVVHVFFFPWGGS